MSTILPLIRSAQSMRRMVDGFAITTMRLPAIELASSIQPPDLRLPSIDLAMDTVSSTSIFVRQHSGLFVALDMTESVRAVARSVLELDEVAKRAEAFVKSARPRLGRFWGDLYCLTDPWRTDEEKLAAVKRLLDNSLKRPVAHQRWRRVESKLRDRANENQRTMREEFAHAAMAAIIVAAGDIPQDTEPDEFAAVLKRGVGNAICEDFLGAHWRRDERAGGFRELSLSHLAFAQMDAVAESPVAFEELVQDENTIAFFLALAGERLPDAQFRALDSAWQVFQRGGALKNADHQALSRLRKSPHAPTLQRFLKEF